MIAGVALIGASCQGENVEETNTDDSAQASSSAIAIGDTTAFEAENLTRTSSVVGSKVTSEAAASGGKYVEFNGTAASGAWIEFALTNVAAGSYDLKMLYKSNNNRGIVQASVDGINQGTACNEYAATAGYKVACGLGSTTLTAGSHKVRFTVTGKASSSTGYQMVVDQIALTFKGATCSAPGAASTPATGISRSAAAPVCAGTATTLAVLGGSLGSGASWVWYASSAHTTSIGRGFSITVSPSSTTTYYVRAEGPCGTTADASTTVSVVPPPQFAQNPQSYTAPCNSTDWVSFTATPAAGTTVSSVQWFYQYPGGSQAYAPDANDRYRVGWNTFNLKVAPQSSQYVWCTIIDACGAQASSAHALLTVPDSSSCL